MFEHFKLQRFILNLRTREYIPLLTTILGIICYFAQSVNVAYTGKPNLDEGLYVYKGWLLVIGQYTPYEVDGLYLNHGILSFLIPGYIQTWFGPGIIPARFFMVFMGLFLLLGLWLTARRFGGPWGGVLGVWIMALMPDQISLYSRGMSQLLVAVCLTWIMYLVLGVGRGWKQILGAWLLSAVMVLIRENMILVIPFLFIYSWLQHGWRLAMSGLTAFAIIFLGVHALYWPEILIVWAPWLSFDLTFLGYIESDSTQSVRTMDIISQEFFFNRTVLFFQSMVGNFPAVLGMIFIFLGWPNKTLGDEIKKVVLFLQTLMLFLFIAHSWAALGGNYCPSCLAVYIPFFSPIAIILLVIFFAKFLKAPAILPWWIPVIVLLLLSTGVGLGTFESTGIPLMEIPVFTQGRDEPVLLWQILANKFSFQPPLLRRLLPAVAGFVAGGMVMCFGVILYRVFRFKVLSHGLMISFLGLAFLLPFLKDSSVRQYCSENVFQAYEQVGEQLRNVIPAGSAIYWAGYSPITLLYLPGVEILPAQLNLKYSYRNSVSFERARTYGFWSAEIGQAWLDKSDYVLFYPGSDPNVRDWMGDRFERIDTLNMPETCHGNIELQVFRRK